jgi:dCMP deaminase
MGQFDKLTHKEFDQIELALEREDSLIDPDKLQKKLERIAELNATASGRRPNWDDYFMGLSFLVSRRSRDPNTKHGCVITDRYHHILGTGYNSWPKGMRDWTVPTSRPDPDKPDEPSKYDYVEGTHSEKNAIANCMVSPHMLPLGATAYVTGKPCNSCLGLMVNANITRIYYAKRKGTQLESVRTDKVFAHIVADTRITVREVVPDLTWLFDQELMDELRTLGFIQDSNPA